MRFISLLLLPLLLITTGCSSLTTVQQQESTIPQYLWIVKTQGCAAIPEPALRLLVFWIKTRVVNYPQNGICNPNWVNDVLQQVIDKWERESGIYNGSARVENRTDSGYRQLDKRNRTRLPFETIRSNDHNSG